MTPVARVALAGVLITALSIGALTVSGTGLAGRRGAVAVSKAAAQARTLGHSKHVHHPPGTIVGRDTPHLIPDDVAYGLMLRAIAGMAANGGRSLEFYFSNIQVSTNVVFTEQDRLRVVDVAQKYVESTSRGAPPANARGVHDGRAAAATAAWLELEKTLTPDSLYSLQLHVQNRVKQNVVILK